VQRKARLRRNQIRMQQFELDLAGKRRRIASPGVGVRLSPLRAFRAQTFAVIDSRSTTMF